MAIARVAEIAPGVERAGEAVGCVERERVRAVEDLMLHLPFEIWIVVERDLVAQCDAGAEAGVAAVRGGDAEAVAEIEARSEAVADVGHAGALVGRGLVVSERDERRDYECARGGAHRLNRRPTSNTNAHVSGTPGKSLRFWPPPASVSDSGWSLIARMICSYCRFALKRWTYWPVVAVGVK